MENSNNFFKNFKSKSLHYNPSVINYKFQNGAILNRILNFDDTEPKMVQRNRYLLVKKINLKDKINKYYSKALDKIFSDVNKYLEHYYEGKKIIIGKKCTSKGLKELKDYFYRKNKKKRTLRKNDLKSNFSFFSKTGKNKTYLDFTKNNSTDTTKNNFFSKKDFIIKYPLSDNELKIIFQESTERERNNKNEKIDISSESNKDEINKKINNLFDNKNGIYNAIDLKPNTERMNINNMLNLQEKILKDRILKNKTEKKLKNKLMNATLKKNSKLLMNNKKELIILKNKKIEKEMTNFGILTKENKTMKDWISELRKNNKEKKKINIAKKEVIYYNKDMNSELDSNNSYINNNTSKKNEKHMYKKIDINTLEVKRKSLFSKYKSPINSYYNYKKPKYLSADNSKDKNKKHLDLYIQGKNLLDHEIKISKDLFGKKKKIIHYSYGLDEISTKLFAKSKSQNSVNSTKAIINSIEIHNL